MTNRLEQLEVVMQALWKAGTPDPGNMTLHEIYRKSKDIPKHRLNRRERKAIEVVEKWVKS